MDNSSVTVENGVVWYVTQSKSWLKGGLPLFSRFKFHEHSVSSCGNDLYCWQAPFSKMGKLKVKKEDMVSGWKLIFFI